MAKEIQCRSCLRIDWGERLLLLIILAAVQPLPATESTPRLLREGACINNLYAGTIDGNLNIRLFLARQGEALNGFYYYEKSGKFDASTNRTTFPRLKLEGKIEGNGQFVLTESDTGKAGDKRLGRFIGGVRCAGSGQGNLGKSHWRTQATISLQSD